ncbi:hypothetical protein SDC9_67734 [bioreactor metagenome]|uniref:Uncharacterized protein n=1 Tax=bioreactor metagenome TaxID=1076179 RepID=A0A644XYH7_9ZZZZ
MPAEGHFFHGGKPADVPRRFVGSHECGLGGPDVCRHNLHNVLRGVLRRDDHPRPISPARRIREGIDDIGFQLHGVLLKTGASPLPKAWRGNTPFYSFKEFSRP